MPAISRFQQNGFLTQFGALRPECPAGVRRFGQTHFGNGGVLGQMDGALQTGSNPPFRRFEPPAECWPARRGYARKGACACISCLPQRNSYRRSAPAISARLVCSRVGRILPFAINGGQLTDPSGLLVRQRACRCARGSRRGRRYRPGRRCYWPPNHLAVGRAALVPRHRPELLGTP